MLAGELTISARNGIMKVDAREAVKESKKSNALRLMSLRVLNAKKVSPPTSLPSKKRGPPENYGSCLRIIGSASAKVLVKLPTHQGYPHLCQIATYDCCFLSTLSSQSEEDLAVFPPPCCF
jgi:hypothetical protein